MQSTTCTLAFYCNIETTTTTSYFSSTSSFFTSYFPGWRSNFFGQAWRACTITRRLSIHYTCIRKFRSIRLHTNRFHMSTYIVLTYIILARHTSALWSCAVWWYSIHKHSIVFAARYKIYLIFQLRMLRLPSGGQFASEYTHLERHCLTGFAKWFEWVINTFDCVAMRAQLLRWGEVSAELVLRSNGHHTAAIIAAPPLPYRVKPNGTANLSSWRQHGAKQCTRTRARASALFMNAHRLAHFWGDWGEPTARP